MIYCAYKYYRFIFEYLGDILKTLENTQYRIGYISAFYIGIIQWLKTQMQVEWFGVSYLLLGFVVFTILVDTTFGIISSNKKAKKYYNEAIKHDKNSFEYKLNRKKCKAKRFSSKKLMNTFFKILTLLAYLFFATELTKTEVDVEWVNEAFDIGIGALIKAPVAILWYHEFKSIGKHIEYIYGVKPNTFNIIQRIFEPKINKFFKDGESK